MEEGRTRGDFQRGVGGREGVFINTVAMSFKPFHFQNNGFATAVSIFETAPWIQKWFLKYIYIYRLA
jgi:hypothetical protein